MMKRAALFLLLAVVASWIDLSQSNPFKLPCRTNFYGRQYSYAEVFLNGSTAGICLKNNLTDPRLNCLFFKSMTHTSAMSFDMKVVQNITTPNPPEFNRDLPNINSSMTCTYKVTTRISGAPYMEITLTKLSWTRDSAIAIKTTDLYKFGSVNVTTTVQNRTVNSWSISSAKAKNRTFINLSGCRTTAAPYVVGPGHRKDLSGCQVQTCGTSGSLVSSYTCGIHAICLNNKCHPVPTICTVTGSTIIDFLNKQHSVPDRCVYSLMKPKGTSTFEVLAQFQERRRKDVTLLDHLMLWMKTSGVKIYLEQGGRVLVNETVLQLNATAQIHHGVALSKDQTGVTARILSAKMTVFFDGNTAHISGTSNTSVEGLCGITNSKQISTLKAEKSPDYSINGCEIQHNDTRNITTNCSSITQHCNLMTQAPFTACNKFISPSLFISACTNTLCKYPEVDGHRCQFLEAYAKRCSLRHNVTLGDWRSKAGCPAAPQAVCQNQHCSAHEFCGVKQYGGNRCFCRAIFASKYKRNNTFGEPTVCMQNTATLTLAGCLLEDRGIDHSVLHLKDQNCTGDMDSQTHMVTFSFNSTNMCGTEVVMNNSQVLYKNTIMTRNSSLYGIINRHDDVEIDFSCLYNQPDVKSVSFKIKDSSVVQKIVSGVWNYTLMMNAFTDSTHMSLIGPTTEIQLNQKVWVELKTEGLNAKLIAIVTDSCWATYEPSPNASLRYDLIKNKCPNSADQTVQVMGNGRGTSNSFSFNMFEFSGKTGEVYLHCKLELCPKQGKSCVPNCGGGGSRVRRASMSNYVDTNSALITMVWSK